MLKARVFKAMTLTIRKSADRGTKQLDWLDARFSFSFGDYYDPRVVGFGALRAVNDYRLAPGSGFDSVRREDLEIISYVVDGELRHQDSLGSRATLRRGGAQRLRVGPGLEHSERNASSSDPLRFIHVWILPESRGAAPRYDAFSCEEVEMRDALRLIASPDGRDASLSLDRDVDLYAALLSEGAALAHPLGDDREAWLQVLTGAVRANGELLTEGDGAGLRDEEVLRIEGAEPAEILLFDMARDG